ncbi:tetratricopeptide repeat protein [Bathymodiolus platifrons methanotrophic gill symbiont]|uniref:tetratricopeptide repeat protein n=1 Tax=Bathymodiolus platifrons methanotrophic gill symbiont TaxID=113268 RepID=UPI001C8E8EB3|nr:tetratricopeptide repeat protein [Bathymodiolus platifrons methanotrophic gill symbiont]
MRQNPVKWFRKAAEQGYVSAQDNLGGMYYNGKGVIQDYKEVFTWIRKAAEQGYVSAQDNLSNTIYPPLNCDSNKDSSTRMKYIS